MLAVLKKEEAAAFQFDPNRKWAGEELLDIVQGMLQPSLLRCSVLWDKVQKVMHQDRQDDASVSVRLRQQCVPSLLPVPP